MPYHLIPFRILSKCFGINEELRVQRPALIPPLPEKG
jgi:hypothetical protein